MLTLQQLIRTRMDERGWSYADLAHRAGDELTRSRWQQLGTGVRMRAFPEPHTIALIAHVLEVDVTTVVLACAEALGLDAHLRGPDLAQLLPAGTERLPERMRDAILAVIRAAVAQTFEDDVGQAQLTVAAPILWTKADAPSSKLARNGRA